MNIQLIEETAFRTLAGTISFPEVVSNLLHAGVEFYHVDYVAGRKTFYADDNRSTVTTLIDFPNLPAVAADLEVAAVKAAILDSQWHGQKFHDFTRRVMTAGVHGYFAFLRGQRVTYFGRQGDQHTEWFPGAQPVARA